MAALNVTSAGPFTFWAVAGVVSPLLAAASAAAAPLLGAYVPLQLSVLQSSLMCPSGAFDTLPPLDAGTVAPFAWVDTTSSINLTASLSCLIAAITVTAFHSLVFFIAALRNLITSTTRGGSGLVGACSSAAAGVRFPSLSLALSRVFFIGMLFFSSNAMADARSYSAAGVAAFALVIYGPPSIFALYSGSSNVYRIPISDTHQQSCLSAPCVWFPESAQRCFGSLFEELSTDHWVSIGALLTVHPIGAVALLVYTPTSAVSCEIILAASAVWHVLFAVLLLVLRPAQNAVVSLLAALSYGLLAAQCLVGAFVEEGGSSLIVSHVVEGAAYFFLVRTLFDVATGVRLFRQQSVGRATVVNRDTELMLSRAGFSHATLPAVTSTATAGADAPKEDQDEQGFISLQSWRSPLLEERDRIRQIKEQFVAATPVTLPSAFHMLRFVPGLDDLPARREPYQDDPLL